MKPLFAKKLKMFILLLASVVISVFTGPLTMADPVETDLLPEGEETANYDPVQVSDKEALAEYGYELAYQTDKLALYSANEGEYRGTFAVENKADESVWYSNPPDASQDMVAMNMMRLKSLLSVTCYNAKEEKLVEQSSKSGSVEQDGLKIVLLKKGIRFDFYFPELLITIPLTVLLNDDNSVTAKIAVDAIKEEGDMRLFTVSMLPMFCAAGDDAEGFMLVPDGSGAVINLNNGKTGYSNYSQHMYGGDAGDILDKLVVTTERAHMPVYGLSKSSGALFAVITEGAAQSTVSASISGTVSGYNTVWHDFTLRKITTFAFEEGWQGRKEFPIYQESTPTIKTVETRYYILTAGQSDLTGMTECYRKYLTEQGLSGNVGTPQVYVDYLGAVTRHKSVLGFPTDAKMKVTSFDEAVTITEQLKEQGVTSLNIRMLGWDSRSVEGKIVSKASPLGLLGGKSGLKKLSTFLTENNIGFYPDINLTGYSKTSYPFQEYIDATRNLNHEINRIYPYKINLFTQDNSYKPNYLLPFKKLQETAASFLKSYDKLKIGALSLSGLPSFITSDFSDTKIPDEQWKGEEVYRGLVKNTTDGRDLLLDDANVYAAVYAKHIINMPEGSGYDITDYAVPFYQMALSGSVSYAGRPINLTADSRQAFLRALESGSGLHYALSYHSESEQIKGTAYSYWIGSGYEQWASVIAEQTAEMNDVYEKLGGNRLISYRKSETGISICGFEGGGELLINFGDSPLVEGEITVSAEGYVIRKGGVVVEQSKTQ